MNEAEQKKIQHQLDKWKNDPVKFIKDMWPGTIVWPKLAEIAKSVRDNRSTVVPSGHGIGKSFIAGKLVIWWLFTHYPSKVITTAPTWSQVEAVLWSEIRGSVLHCKFPLVDERDVLQTELKLAPDWFAKGLSTTERVEQRQYGSAKFQGFHSPYLLVIMDEAPGVDAAIHIAFESLATGKENRILKIGNPTSPTGPFYNDCYSSNAHKIQISCFDHPNVIEDKEVIPGCVTKEWIEARREEWGDDSPLWKAKVLGEFPDETEDTLIPLSWIEAAVHTELEPSDVRVLGVDVARFGDDKTVLGQMISNEFTFRDVVSKQDTMQTAGRIVNWEADYDKIYIEIPGVGGGVYDRAREVLNDPLREHKTGHKIIAFEPGSKADSFKRFLNLRAEAYWSLRERLRPDGQPWMKIKLPDDDELKGQLASLKYEFTSDGRIKMESKEDMKKRGLKSPDKADSLMIAAWGAIPHKPREIASNPIFREFFEAKRAMGNKVDRLDSIHPNQ